MNAIREEVYKYGVMAKDAVFLEMRKHKSCWTTDHWTGPSGETFTTTTMQYIENWKLQNSMIDFKVHGGRTTGERIFQDHISVMSRFNDKPLFSLMGITDTTGSMGTLGAHLRDDGREHAYCTDHVFHLNALLAFSGTLGFTIDKCKHVVIYNHVNCFVLFLVQMKTFLVRKGQ